MTIVGVIMMLLSYAVVLVLMVYCYYRIFKLPGGEPHGHSPLGIDTGGEDEPGDDS
ncbi:MAG: hypothetical protein ACU826_08815 [Gammaproteobacteria bacterium]